MTPSLCGCQRMISLSSLWLMVEVGVSGGGGGGGGGEQGIHQLDGVKAGRE